jgi:hypothetical protein
MTVAGACGAAEAPGAARRRVFKLATPQTSSMSMSVTPRNQIDKLFELYQLNVSCQSTFLGFSIQNLVRGVYTSGGSMQKIRENTYDNRLIFVTRNLLK